MATAIMRGLEAWWDLRGPALSPGPGAAPTASRRVRDLQKRDRRKSHEQKKGYETVEQADAAEDRYNQRIVLRFGRMQSYPCRFCKRFHIGHSENIGGRAFSAD